MLIKRAKSWCWVTYCDSHGYTNEEHEDSEVSIHRPWLVPKLVVQPNCNGTSHAKGDGHADNTDIEGNFPVTEHETEIDFKTDDEEEQGQSEVGDQVQVGHRLSGKDRFCEAWDATENGRAEKDTTDNLRDYARLANLREGPAYKATDNDDNRCL